MSARSRKSKSDKLAKKGKKGITKKNEKAADVNRTRKSKSQKDYLWKVYRQLDGQTPSREKINALARELKLSIN